MIINCFYLLIFNFKMINQNKLSHSIDFQETNKLYNDAIDLKSSIRINWDSFSKFLMKKSKKNYTEEQNEKINEYLKDCKNLIGEHIKIIKEISKLKEDNDIKTEGLSSFNEKISEQYKKETRIYTDLQKELSDKKTILNNLEKKLVKVRAKALFKDSKNEIFIIEPTKENLEMNEEIIKLKESIEELEKKDKVNSKKIINLRNELNITQKVLSVKQYNYYNNINK